MFIKIFLPRQLPGTEWGENQQQFDDELHKQLRTLLLLSRTLHRAHHFKHRHADQQRAPSAILGKTVASLLRAGSPICLGSSSLTARHISAGDSQG